MVIYAVNYFFNALIFLLFVRALMSWFVRDLNNPIVRIIYQLTDPILGPMQEIFERFGLNRSGIDFSFLATFLLLQLVQQLVIQGLFYAGF